MIIFYDAGCPLCNAEMQQLKTADIEQKIVLEDINAADFDMRFPHINKEKAMQILHAQTDAGEMMYGLDVTYAAWKTVGKHRWLKILRLPVIRIVADLGYTIFAKYRQPISLFLMPNTGCEGNSCSSRNRNSKKNKS
jgi:predicted DCC family thiol-disulfide oxidoreductase YuxK